MIALVVALAIAAFVGVQPLAPTSVAPQVGLAPGLGVSLGEAVPTGPVLREYAVAPAQPARGGAPRLVAHGSGTGGGTAPLEAGIGPARVLTHVEVPPAEAPAGVQGPAPPPAPATPQPTPPESVAVPVAAPAPPEPPAFPGKVPPAVGSPAPGPISAGPEGPAIEVTEPIRVGEGDEFAISLDFLIQPTAYRPPGAENPILRLGDPASELPLFGLQLWDDGAGQRGLWSSGEAIGGERFLAPLTEGVWHTVVAYFAGSADSAGLYLVALDDQPIDSGPIEFSESLESALP